MRTTAVAFAALLLLLLLATRAHAIRLDRQLHEAIGNKKQEASDPKPGDGEASIAGSVKKHCTTDGHCSGKVKTPSVAHAETTESEQQVSSKGGKGGDSAAAEATAQEGSSTKEQDESPATPPRQRQTTYPDIMDIAGMDYSPAARKPPIHN